jgi:hypothetical protein
MRFAAPFVAFLCAAGVIAADTGSIDELLCRLARARGSGPAAERLRVRLRVEEPGFVVEVRYAADRAGRVRVDVFRDGRRVFSEGIDESGAWSMGAEGLPAAASDDALAALEHGRLFNLYDLEELPSMGHRLVLEGRQRRSGRTYDVVRIELTDGFRTWRWIDAKNGRLAILRDRRALHPDIDPRPIWIETRLSDFRAESGVEMPFASRQVDAGTGRWLQTTRILEVERNPCLTDADLHRPESGQPAG